MKERYNGKETVHDFMKRIFPHNYNQYDVFYRNEPRDPHTYIPNETTASNPLQFRCRGNSGFETSFIQQHSAFSGLENTNQSRAPWESSNVQWSRANFDDRRTYYDHYNLTSQHTTLSDTRSDYRQPQTNMSQNTHGNLTWQAAIGLPPESIPKVPPAPVNSMNAYNNPEYHRQSSNTNNQQHLGSFQHQHPNNFQYQSLPETTNNMVPEFGGANDYSPVHSKLNQHTNNPSANTSNFQNPLKLLNTEQFMDQYGSYYKPTTTNMPAIPNTWSTPLESMQPKDIGFGGIVTKEMKIAWLREKCLEMMGAELFEKAHNYLLTQKGMQPPVHPVDIEYGLRQMVHDDAGRNVLDQLVFFELHFE
ncbi:unnamed protein product [Adineta ricciae]|uniref:Uncharacterized protein n=1 Tax=Adineta ricciae TaxID=249248 RepID=A0A816BIK6_ADIRI|nr:unnamed protein product [Adineta ricciae]